MCIRDRLGTYLGGKVCETILHPISITVPVFKLVPIEVFTCSPMIEPKKMDLVSINSPFHFTEIFE